MRTFSLTAAALCSALTAYPASAQDQAAVADALFEQGRAALEKGDLDTACERFRESDKLDPAPGTKLNLANCEEQRGHLATAWELFKALAQALPAGDERLPTANEKVAALGPRVPRLTLRFPHAPAGVTIRRGEFKLGVGVLGVPLPMDPGTYEFLVGAPGHNAQRFSVKLAAGESKVLVLALDEIEADVPAATPAETPDEPSTGAGASDGSSRRTLAYVAGGVGVAGIAVGTIFGVLALGKKSVADDNCRLELRLCNQTGADANSSGRTLGLVSTIGFVVGVAGLGTGAWLWFSGGNEAKGQTALGSVLAPGGVQLSLRRTW